MKSHCFVKKMSKKNEKAAAAAAAAAVAAAGADNAYDSMSDPDIEIEEKTDTDLLRLNAKTTLSVSPALHPFTPVLLHLPSFVWCSSRRGVLSRRSCRLYKKSRTRFASSSPINIASNFGRSKLLLARSTSTARSRLMRLTS